MRGARCLVVVGRLGDGSWAVVGGGQRGLVCEGTGGVIYFDPKTNIKVEGNSISLAGNRSRGVLQYHDSEYLTEGSDFKSNPNIN